MPAGHAVPLAREGGIKVGEIRVLPHWAAEASLLLARWSLLAAVALAMALFAAVVVGPVRRALHQAGEIQGALARAFRRLPAPRDNPMARPAGPRPAR